MTHHMFNALLDLHHSPWLIGLDLAGHFVAGALLSTLYFTSLWWNARRLASGGGVLTTVTLMLARFALLAGLLVLASFEGALPLLTMALGVLIARPAVMARIGREAITPT